MSGVKNWLMEMQEHSHYLIDTMQVDEARKHFINVGLGSNYVNQFIR